MGASLEERLHRPAKGQGRIRKDSGRTSARPGAAKAAPPAAEPGARLQLTERDSLLAIDLLKNPPAPNAKLIAAARALRSKRL